MSQAADTVTFRKAPKPVQEHLVCIRYAQVRVFNRVAKEFGIKAEQVKRIWSRQPEEKKREYLSHQDEINETITEKVGRAEADLYTDDFITKAVQGRNLALAELISRISPKEVTDEEGNVTMECSMSDKELINAVRLLTNITGGKSGDDRPDSPQVNILNAFTQTIKEDVENGRTE